MDGRKKLVPFMKRMIGKCPGVIWEDEEEGMFRIPWRHFNNREWKEDDSRIFLEWAKHTGKYKDGDDLDWPTWKTQLRCALNKIPEIEPVKERFKLEIPNPYRVYRFVSADSAKNKRPGSVKSEKSDMSPSWSPQSFADETRTNSPALTLKFGNCSPHESPLYNQPLAQAVPTVVEDIERKIYDEAATTQINQYSVLGNAQVHVVHDVQVQLPQNVDFLTEEHHVQVQNNQTNFQPQVSEQYMATSYAPNILVDPSSQSSHMYSQGAEAERLESESKPSLPSDLKSIETNDFGICGMETEITSIPNSFGSHTSMPSDDAAQKEVQGGNMGELRHQIRALDYQQAHHLLESPPVFTYEIYYGFQFGQRVISGQVGRRGCRIYYKAHQELFQGTLLYDRNVIGPADVDQIPLKDPTQCVSDQFQVQKLRELLENMDRGLVLTVDGQDIYAQRLCKTRIFVTDEASYSNPIDRHKAERTKIFSFEKQHQRKKDRITLTFGQEIRQGHQFPMKKVLLSMIITHWHLRTVLHDEPLSLNSCEPLLSRDDEQDRLVRGFRNQCQLR